MLKGALKWHCAPNPSSDQICTGSCTFKVRFFLPALPLTAIDIYFPISIWISAIYWKQLHYQINKTYGTCLNTNEAVYIIVPLGFQSCIFGNSGYKEGVVAECCNEQKTGCITPDWHGSVVSTSINGLFFLQLTPAAFSGLERSFLAMSPNISLASHAPSYHGPGAGHWEGRITAELMWDRVSRGSQPNFHSGGSR